MIEISPDLSIPEEEIDYQMSRGGGPGGQNVNKVATRIVLFFDVANSPTLSESQKSRLLDRLSNRISKKGVLRIVSREHRTQLGNRRAARQRFADLIAKALRDRKSRKKTRVPASVRRRRLEAKSRRAALKRTRSRKDFAGD